MYTTIHVGRDIDHLLLFCHLCGEDNNFLSGILFTIPVLVSVFLTVLTLVSLCSRACRYNMCVTTDNCSYKESDRKALKEILPLFIPLPSYVPFSRYFLEYM